VLSYYMLLHGDCLELMPTLGDNCVDMVLVDLPYGVTKCKWDIAIDLAEMWVQLKRICKPNANIVFFCTTKFGYQLIHSNKKWFRYDIVWSKPNSRAGFQHANRMPMRKHEMVYVFGNPSAGGKTYNSQKTTGHKPYDRGITNSKSTLYSELGEYESIPNTGDRHPSSIIESILTGEKRLHPTQKPVALCEWLIKTYSNEGDVVLDFTMGSGSTIVAAKNTGREFIGIELDEDIFKIAEERLNEE
jgi:DNA modification methylase